MSQPLPNPPPGFETLSLDEKIEYIESLWDAVLNGSEMPVPDWHRDLIRERLDAYRRNPSASRPWAELRADLLAKYQKGT